MVDMWGRNITYLRVSVTDRCNLRCRYCIPTSGLEYAAMEELLSLDEIYRAIKLFSELGIQKVRITGGEPLVREGVIQLIRDVKKLPNIKEVYITTNGTCLGDKLRELIEAGIDGVNISLDTLREDRYRYITGGGDFNKTMEAVFKAIESGIGVKINTVAMKKFNDDEILDFAALSEKYPVDIRFIELMPIGEKKEFEEIPSDLIKEIILKNKEITVYKDEKRIEGPAEYIKPKDGKGRIGFISPLSHSFCSNCNRIRLTSKGFVKQCLHWKYGVGIRDFLRSNKSDEDIKNAIRKCIYSKPQEHCFNKISENADKQYMSQIGG